MFAHERSLVEKNRTRPFALVGVNEDPSLEKFQTTEKKKQLNWRSFWDGGDGSIARRWKADSGLPALYLIDHKGMIRWHATGVPDLKKLDDLIEQLLKDAENDGGKQAVLSRDR
jgi:hypothetical protein